MQPQILVDEEARVAALAEYDLLGSSPAPSFTHIVALAARLFQVASAFVSLVDRENQVFHAKVGLSLCETSREIAFCSHTIAQPDPLVVLDATSDPRFHDNPLVTGPPYIRFYVGIPLTTPSGHAVGTLCLVDAQPRNVFTHADQQILQQLADLILDRMELRRLEVAQRASQSRFEHIASTSPDGIICANAEGSITVWNAAAERLFGYATADAIGRSIDLIVPERMKDGLRRVPGSGKPWLVGKTVELPACHADGTEFPIELSLSQWQEDERTAFGAIVRDIRERRANEEQLFRLAHLDPLTELPNRTVLRERLSAITATARPVTVLMLDLDGVKEINDSHGYDAGDAVLREVAVRLLRCIHPTDTASRLDGDGFVLLLPNLGDPLQASAAAESVICAITAPVEYGGQTLRLSASIGIALSPAHGDTADDLLSCANLALNQARTRDETATDCSPP